MKVLSLRCANGHGFEGWFASDDDYVDQNGRGAIACPLCGDGVIVRTPSAPRLNLSRSAGPRDAAAAVPADAPKAVAEAQPADLQAAWLQTVRKLIDSTDDVGPRFAEEARRIHYGETPARGIRGHATPDERAALHDEGIETMSIPVPTALKGPVQ